MQLFPNAGGHGGPPLRRAPYDGVVIRVPPGAIFFLRSQKEYGKKNLPREGLVETAPPLEPTPVCISSHRHMPGDAFAAYRGGIQEMPR